MTDVYAGFELGPIRPPSEAESLMVRVTRNCPWNKCTFCGLYKDEKFSIRPKEHVFEDILRVRRAVESLHSGDNAVEKDWAFHSASNWIRSGMESVFLQDANTLIVKPDDLVAILTFLREQFPGIQRVTSYARSHTVAKISDADLARLADAGLNRIHIGMETASDTVLKRIKKGSDKALHIKAGQNVKRAGIELSEYYMPGLGGLDYAEESALETADALNQINPDFIRIRTLALPDGLQLAEDFENGLFRRTNDIQKVEELLLMVRNLKDVTSTIKSDHILNLLPDVDGVLPDDHARIIDVMERFLALPKAEQDLYRIGRRIAYMKSVDDLDHPHRRAKTRGVMESEQITPANIDAVSDSLMKRFI